MKVFLKGSSQENIRTEPVLTLEELDFVAEDLSNFLVKSWFYASRFIQVEAFARNLAHENHKLIRHVPKEKNTQLTFLNYSFKNL